MTMRLPVFALILGCTPELEPIRWDAIDVAELRDAIANPTGTVDEASADEVAAAIVERHEPYRVLADYLHQVFADDDADADDPVWVIPQALDGTSVYVIVACPGPLGGDAPAFSQGSMRIDSPTLSADLIATFAIRGQLQLSFRNCVIADYSFNGVAPGFHDGERRDIGVVPRLEVVDELSGESVSELREPILIDAASGRVSALFELSSSDTLTLEWSATELALRLRGRNGALICTILGELLDCVPP